MSRAAEHRPPSSPSAPGQLPPLSQGSQALLRVRHAWMFRRGPPFLSKGTPCQELDFRRFSTWGTSTVQGVWGCARPSPDPPRASASPHLRVPGDGPAWPAPWPCGSRLRPREAKGGGDGVPAFPPLTVGQPPPAAPLPLKHLPLLNVPPFGVSGLPMSCHGHFAGARNHALVTSACPLGV